MEKRKIIVCLSVLLLAGICGLSLHNIKRSKNKVVDVNNIPVAEKNVQTEKESVSEDVKETKEKNVIVKKDVKQAAIQKEAEFEKKANLYSSANSSLPLSTIAEMANTSEFIRSKVEKISETNNIFMAKKSGDKLIVITDNPANIRHNVEITEISLVNGHQIKTTLGYNDKIKDSDNDIWGFENETNRPTRHTKYNNDGDIEFVEVWNYDEKEPIKYEMKDAEGHVVSMRKETVENGTDLRVEHIVYDNSGNTRISVSVTYDGPDVKRFTYYNADKTSESGSVFDEYSNGLKTKETVYTSDLKVKNHYTSDYKDGNRESITIWNPQNKEIQKLVNDAKDEL